MKKTRLSFLLACCALCVAARAQRIVYHTDLPKTLADNSAYKIGMNTTYATTMDNVRKYRQSMSENMAVVDMVQNKIYSALSTVDDAMKNGRYLYYMALKLPRIVSNIAKAGQLAIDKPYLFAYWSSTGEILTLRINGLQQYLRDFLLTNRDSVLIDPVRRDQFIYTTYRDVCTIYNVTEAMVSQFELYNLNDAIGKIVPYQWYINLDKSIVQSTLSKFKF